ncbi:MAG TPA: aldehyde dehydrogenase (NADP(+)) [Stackebrandtia sp.]|jgi:NADP-dependent aldehyde dehydrogenase|uniref:aldehyde dehydrogenase (NADP(+)) n=1 Tax=Stackebrandtia sp. TaxID=2023065 RepID=UPI002D230B61|nr:aldehyde dehydrogenase (NADP(+)) [Stackebrandtia sp.]HZE39474.1 aldehyde dehydrogenase (NADP(+)) [Stackebrandtia sp.]
MSTVISTDPRTGDSFGEPFPPTPTAKVAAWAAEAAAVAADLDARGRAFRAGLLRGVADALEASRADIVAVADAETGIGQARLGGELTRTVYQARLFAEVLDEASYLEAAIDHAGQTPLGPGPDLRRMLVPLGPVAVFGASNFPLAFSVPGGDTVSALAAGCPVILKAHESHPATSRLAFEVMGRAIADAGADPRVLHLVYGREAGTALVADPHITAVGFTGSLGAGRALMDVIDKRPEPIPFYGELSSLNPIVVTASALRSRAADIARGLVNSFTFGAGQLCTKPGLVFVPGGDAGDDFAAAVAELAGAAEAGVALNAGIAASYASISADLSTADAASVAADGGAAPRDGFWMSPKVLSVGADKLTAELTGECFGPLTILARYRDASELDGAIDALPSSLTATIHAEPDDSAAVAELSQRLRAKAGRVIYDGFPTGVRVAWAQTHGGPWPATNSAHTSVGASAIRRFLRPVTWQDAPEFVLPPELRDAAVDIPRRVDGRLVLPG